MSLWPSSLSQIPPELTNRYVKNEAFIVVVFNDFLTLLPTTTITILLLLLLLLSTSFSPNWLRSQLAPSCQLSMWQGIFHKHWNISIFHWNIMFEYKSLWYLNIWIFDCLDTLMFSHWSISTFGYSHLMLLWDSLQLCSPNPPLLLFYKYPRLRSKKMWKCLYVNVSDDNEWRKIKV